MAIAISTNLLSIRAMSATCRTLRLTIKDHRAATQSNIQLKHLDRGAASRALLHTHIHQIMAAVILVLLATESSVLLINRFKVVALFMGQMLVHIYRAVIKAMCPVKQAIQTITLAT